MNPLDNRLRTAAEQFLASSMAFVTAVENIGSRVDNLDSLHSTSAADVVSIRERLAGTEDRLKTIEQKPPDKLKSVQIGVSVAALIISLVTAFYSVKFGGASLETSSQANIRDATSRARTAQFVILTLITQLDAVHEQAYRGQPQPVGAVSLLRQYDSLIAQVDTYRQTYGFSAIGERNFASLMRDIFYFGYKEDASLMWQSVGSVQVPGKAEASHDLALVHAEYAKLVQSRDEMDMAVNRLKDIWKDLDPSRQLSAHVLFAEMYNSVTPQDAASIKKQVQQRDLAKDLVTAHPDFRKDFGPRIDVT